MRTKILVLTAVALAWVFLAAWPLVGLRDLAGRVSARDVVGLSARIDFPSVRQSLTAQVMQSYLRLAGRDLTPMARDIAVSVGTTIADPLVARLVSPEALAELLETGWPARTLPDNPGGFSGLDPRSLGTTWQLFENADYGIGRFSVSVPAVLPQDRQFRIDLKLGNWIWKLSAIQLPEAIRERLARELLKEHPPSLRVR